MEARILVREERLNEVDGIVIAVVQHEKIHALGGGPCAPLRALVAPVLAEALCSSLKRSLCLAV